MNIIGKNLGNAKKHNGKILEHKRHRPSTCGCQTGYGKTHGESRPEKSEQ